MHLVHIYGASSNRNIEPYICMADAMFWLSYLDFIMDDMPEVISDACLAHITKSKCLAVGDP